MGIGSEFRKLGRKFENTSRRTAKYTFAAGGAMFGGSAGARAGYEIGSAFDDRKPQLQQTGTDLGKLRSEATANGFNPLTVLRATGGQGFYRNQIPMGRLSSQSFFNAFDVYESVKQKNTPVIEEPVDPYQDPNGFLKPEKKIDGTIRYFKKPDGTDTEIEVGTNILELSFDQIMQIRAEDFEEQYGDLAQIVFGVIRLGSDIIDVTKQKAAIRKAIDVHKRSKSSNQKGAGDRSGSKLKTFDLSTETLKALNNLKYIDKTHPRNTNRGNFGKLRPLQ